MTSGDRVQVKRLTGVEREFQGRTGTVIADSGHGEVILVHMDDEPETEARQFLEEHLEQVN